ncbi:MAG: ABC transporter substrate-binding protein [Haloarculaceae archaeon]
MTRDRSTAPGEQSIDRRRFLGVVGSGLGAGFAGCLGGSSDTVDISGDEVKNSTTVLGHAFPHVPKNYDLNPWTTSYRSGFPSLLFEYGATRCPDGRWEFTDLVESVDVESTGATVTYSDAFTWWNGEPVTARDRWVAVRIDNELGVRTGVDSVELVDDHTLRYEFPSPVRRSIALSRTVDYVHNVPAWLYGKWLDRLETATTDTERDSVGTALQSEAVRLDEAAERGIGCGPYELAEVSPNRMILERFEDHPNADEISVPRLWLPVVKGMRIDSMTQDGDLDLGQKVLGESDGSRSLPDYIDQRTVHATPYGVSLLFNFGAPHVARRNVRRAFASVLPLDVLARNGEWGRPVSLQTGLFGPSQRQWLGGSLYDRLYEYPVEGDEERAAAFLRDAGYERDGGKWRDRDGNRLRVYVETPLWGRWSVAAQTLKKTLTEFGVRIDLDMYSEAAFLSHASVGNFGMSAYRTIGRPLEAYDVTATDLGSLASGVTDPDRVRGDRGRPMEVTIPSEPGRLSVEGDGRTIDLFELYRELRRPISDERTREIVSLFARWWNYELPNLQLATTMRGVWGNTRDFQWPEEGNDTYRTAGPAGRVDYHLLRTGAVSPAD